MPCHAFATSLSHTGIARLMKYPAVINLHLRTDLNIDGLGYEFLKTDLAVGQRFAEIARAAVHDPAKRERNRVRAQESHDSVRSFLHRIRLREEERAEIDTALEQLRRLLAEMATPG
jgi:hypothetical protein